MKTIQDVLKEKGYSRYRLSKESGVPWATLSDISKLAKVLDMPMEEVILLKAEPEFTNGIPQEKNYLETDLPPSIQKAIDDFIKGEEENVLHLDCLWGELYGAINASQWDNSITLEQADYLRKKYLFGEEEERDD